MTAKKIQREIEMHAELIDSLPAWLDIKESGFTRKLGGLFQRKAGAYFSNGLKLEKCGKEHQALLWRITREEIFEEWLR